MKKVFLWSALFSLFSLTVMQAQEQKTKADESVITFAVGDYQITTLSEGQQEGSTGVLIGASPDILKQYAPDGTYPTATNAFLVKTADKMVLIDAGFGKKLFDNLQTRKVTAEKIDAILLTHMHGDHIGGLLKDGKAAFPNATLYIAQAEHDYWMNDKARGAQARTVIEAYKDRLHLFAPKEIELGGAELVPGLKAIAAFGHTPGHTTFMVESGDAKMLVWGDLTHAMAVQMPHPEIAVTYDTDPQQAIASRKKIFDYVKANNIPVAGMHIAFPAVGDVKTGKNGKYIFNPLCLCLGL